MPHEKRTAQHLWDGALLGHSPQKNLHFVTNRRGKVMIGFGSEWAGSADRWGLCCRHYHNKKKQTIWNILYNN